MTVSAKTGYLDLIKQNRDFRLLWYGQVVSLLGDWFNLVAIASLIAVKTDSGAAVGGLFAVRTLSFFLASPFAGVVADRFDRKNIMVVSDLIRAFVVTGLFLVSFTEAVWPLYLLAGCQMATAGFFYPAKDALLPSLVDKGQIGAANAISAATWSSMMAIGTALGGLLTGWIGPGPAFLADTATFALSAFLVSRIATVKKPSVTPGAGSLFMMMEGIRYLVAHKDILLLVLQKGAVAFSVSGGLMVAQTKLSQSVYVYGKGGGTGLGLMFAVLGAGTGLGPFFVRYLTGDDDEKLLSAISWGWMLMVAGLCLVALLKGFVLFLAGILLRGVGGGVLWVFSTQILMQRLPDRVRGRVFAADMAIFTLFFAFSAQASGWIIDQPFFGIEDLLWTLVALSGFFFGLWLLFRKRA